MHDTREIGRVFTARVASRSSHGKGGPPGEKEIMRKNPTVVETIRSEMGWNRVELGTLNLECDESSLQQLFAQFEPTLCIPAESVQYPKGYAHIPRKRRCYLYFGAEIRFNGNRRKVLLRRAENPVKGRVEVIADMNLREAFGFGNRDGDEIVCEIECDLSA